MMKQPPRNEEALVARAYAFAEAAHGDQTRRVTGEPYIVHPAEVAKIVESTPEATPTMLAAALLHDVLEDTSVTEAELRQEFGDEVTDLVVELTKPAKRKEYMPRAARVQNETNRLASASKEAQTIKVADIISNVSTIVEVDPEFAKIYLPEKKEQLAVLMKAPHQLLIQADNVMHGVTDRLKLLEAHSKVPA
jgi:(p)ppGpp synthase/HD superfamily hydrolase